MSVHNVSEQFSEGMKYEQAADIFVEFIYIYSHISDQEYNFFFFKALSA